MKLKVLKKNWLLWSVILFSLVFFLYKLGTETLAPWDEAWYGVISRNWIRGSVLFELKYLGSPYWDHPPLGFYLMGGSYLLLGISEFSTRLPQALMGLLGIGFLYLTGKKIKNKWVGLLAAMMVLSMRWYLVRARTGNLDALLAAMQAGVIYFAMVVEKRRELFLMWVFLALSMLSKSTIGGVLAPLVLIGTVEYWWRKRDVKGIVMAVGLFTIVWSPWFVFNYLKYGKGFLNQHFLKIGLRGATTKGVSIEIWKRTLLYWRSAVHKWYWPIWAGFLGSMLFLYDWRVRKLLLAFLLVAIPFFLSSETHIWHMIPMMVPAALLTVVVAENLREKIVGVVKNKKLKEWSQAVMILVFLLISLHSLGGYFRSFIDVERKEVGQMRLAKIASDYNLFLVLQDTTSVPTVAFYADTEMDEFSGGAEEIMVKFKKPFLLITQEYMWNKQGEILAEEGGGILVLYE